jgi:hypothetical protein
MKIGNVKVTEEVICSMIDVFSVKGWQDGNPLCCRKPITRKSVMRYKETACARWRHGSCNELWCEYKKLTGRLE